MPYAGAGTSTGVGRYQSANAGAATPRVPARPATVISFFIHMTPSCLLRRRGGREIQGSPFANKCCMNALSYFGPGKLRVVDKPDPRIEHPDDIVLRVTRSAICGSDLHLYNGLVPDTRVGS